MNETTTPPPVPGTPRPKGRGCLFYGGVALAVALAVVVVSAATASWMVRRQFHAKPFTPVTLSEKEQVALEKKIDLVVPAADEPAPGDAERPHWVKQEEAVTNVITFSEKELNALLATNTELGDKAYVVLGRNSISARYNIPIDPDAPFLGGKTLRGRVTFGVEPADGRLSVRMDDVRIWGISLPNAWLGGLKGVDLFETIAGTDTGMQRIAEGIAAVDVQPGRITITLAD